MGAHRTHGRGAVETVRLFGMLAAGFGAVVLLFSVVPAGAAGFAGAPSAQPSKACGNYCALPSPTTSQNSHVDGSVGNADNKNPKGQSPNGSDNNKGYECDKNKGIGDGNPAHTVNCPSPTTRPTTPALINVTIGQLTAAWPCGAVSPTYSVPAAPAHAVYSRAAGSYPGTAGAVVAVTVTYDAGYTGPSSMSVTLPSAAAPCNQQLPTATPAAPSVVDSVCSNGTATIPTFTVPSTTGIDYTPASGTYPGTAGSSTTVTAAAASGYQLAAGSQTSFGITFAAAPVCSSPSTPTSAPITGGGGGGATAPSPKPKPKPVTGGGGGAAVTPTAGGGGALPFTGDRSGSLLRAGFGLLLGGLFLTMLARRRVVVE